MKFARGKFLVLAMIAVILLNGLVSKSLKNRKSHKQVHLVRDMNGFNSDVQQVVRRSPSVTTVTRMGNFRLTPPSNNIYMSNSNTSNLPNVGNLGVTAEIVGKNTRKFKIAKYKFHFTHIIKL